MVNFRKLKDALAITKKKGKKNEKNFSNSQNQGATKSLGNNDLTKNNLDLEENNDSLENDDLDLDNNDLEKENNRLKEDDLDLEKENDSLEDDDLGLEKNNDILENDDLEKENDSLEDDDLGLEKDNDSLEDDDLEKDNDSLEDDDLGLEKDNDSLEDDDLEKENDSLENNDLKEDKLDNINIDDSIKNNDLLNIEQTDTNLNPGTGNDNSNDNNTDNDVKVQKKQNLIGKIKSLFIKPKSDNTSHINSIEYLENAKIKLYSIVGILTLLIIMVLGYNLLYFSGTNYNLYKKYLKLKLINKNKVNYIVKLDNNYKGIKTMLDKNDLILIQSSYLKENIIQHLYNMIKVVKEDKGDENNLVTKINYKSKNISVTVNNVKYYDTIKNILLSLRQYQRYYIINDVGITIDRRSKKYTLSLLLTPIYSLYLRQ